VHRFDREFRVQSARLGQGDFRLFQVPIEG
jgi:hypothetical protein